ncbi:hypothetical protein EXM22_05295 [Oceanispirochaeta crateris]|uniref:Uncharacterized protein n=1 Tax=Oceanispirochaeta crateris TaxID=2518645 RepID=A0A5C1QMP7_9SPIO|nr:SoxR reducing system RseC family protein [Oceanispirochaeta crateris]QEN07432.1 hypothetical protein EXM22_05295 [Oceanispirochaeta crateris]
MAKFARILEIKNNRALLGLLNDGGSCGSGTCEGCSCSSGMQTMTLTLPESSNFKVGMDVEMIAPKTLSIDWFLLIILPVLLVVTVSFLPQLVGWQADEQTRNLWAMAAGFLGFLLSAVLLKLLRKDQTIDLVEISRTPKS